LDYGLLSFVAGFKSQSKQQECDYGLELSFVAGFKSQSKQQECDHGPYSLSMAFRIADMVSPFKASGSIATLNTQEQDGQT
jgi:hypothetical protein